MKTRLSAAAAVLLLLPAPALADDCLDALEKIDAALTSAQQIADEPLVQVKKLRSMGEKQHNEGEHDRAMRRLKMSLKIFDQAMAKAEAEAAAKAEAEAAKEKKAGVFTPPD